MLDGFPDRRLKHCAGVGWFEILEWTELPGEWKCEQISKREYTQPKQGKPFGWWRCIGAGWVDA